VTTPIAEFLQALDRQLRAERRLRRARIVTEVRDHLSSTADDLERSGLPRIDAERLAVCLLFVRDLNARSETA
jgi:hypothetical protein